MTVGALRVRKGLLPWQRGQGKCGRGVCVCGGGVTRGLPCTWHPGEMPPSGSGMRPRAGGNCLLVFEGRGVHRTGEGAVPLGGLSGGLWYRGCSADSRGLGEGAPGVGAGEWHVGPGPPRGDEEVRPQTSAGDFPLPAGASGRFLRTPWEGGRELSWG